MLFRIFNQSASRLRTSLLCVPRSGVMPGSHIGKLFYFTKLLSLGMIKIAIPNVSKGLAVAGIRKLLQNSTKRLIKIKPLEGLL